MKIVNHKTFLKLPANTLFSKYKPNIFGDLCIKMEGAGFNKDEPVDFYYSSIVGAVDHQNDTEFDQLLETSMMNPKYSIPMDFESESRDGCFEQAQLYAIYEVSDVEKLIARLHKCLPSKENNNG